MLAFWGVTLLLIAVPGPDWAFVLATGARDRSVLPAVTGLMLGYVLLTGVVAVGLAALLARSSIALTALTLAGAGYLAYLGVALLRHPATTAGVAPGGSRMLRGIAVSGLNPKGLLLFLAVLPQFADRHAAWPVAAQLAVLGSVFVATCGAFYTLLGFGARTVSALRPSATRLVSRISGAAMIAVALLLVLDRIG